MGWTGIETDRSFKEVFCNEMRSDKLEVLRLHQHGDENKAEMYAALQHTEANIVFAVVTLMERNDGEVTFKDMAEFDHPSYYNCPVDIIENLTAPKALKESGIVTQSLVDNAKKWRTECLKRKGQYWKRSRNNKGVVTALNE